MSQKSKRKSAKTGSRLNIGEIKNLSKVTIKISEFENLQNFSDEGIDLEILVTFGKDLSETKKLPSLNTSNHCEVTFIFDIDVDDDTDIFNLFSNPILITLSNPKDSTVIGHANLDLYPLCKDRTENFNRRLRFERELRSKQVQLSRKISFEVEASCNLPLLKKPIANSIYVSFDSIYNLPRDFDDSAEITVGATVPIGEQLNKSTIFATNFASCKSQRHGELKLQWSSLATISGKGSESPFSSTSYKHTSETSSCNPNSQLNFNVISRIILSEESNKFLYDHLRKSLKLPVEVLVGKEHFIGFLDAAELMHVERNHIQAAVPLLKFNNSLLRKTCNVQSSFFEPNPISKTIKKSKKELGKKGSKSLSSLYVDEVDDEPGDSINVPFVNEDGHQVFTVVEVKLEKPLNREVFEDCHEMLLIEDQSTTQSQPQLSETLKSFKSKLEVTTKNVLSIYNNESDVNKILTKYVSDGYFSKVEDHLISQIPVEMTSSYSASCIDDCNADFLCKMTSLVLNENHQQEQGQDMLAQVYNFLGMEKQANEIFLRRIFKNNNEESWISYAVHCLRKQEFNKSMACVDNALSFNQHSIVCHILKAYVEFKQHKYSESERLINFMQFKHGDSVELSMIQHLLKIKDQPEKAKEFKSKLKSHHPLLKVYETPEVLWFATVNDDKLLSWQDPSIKTTVLFIKLGCYDFAELALSEYYKNRGVNVNYSYLLAVIDAAKGDYHNALLHLNKTSKQDIANHQLNYDKIVVLMSLMLMKTGKYERALKLLSCPNKIEEREPEYFLINFMLGLYHNNAGEHNKSLKLLIQSHRILPSHLTLMELGKCYQSLNKTISAEKCFHQSISYDQDARDAWLHLYKIYLKSHRNDLVKTCLEVLKM